MIKLPLRSSKGNPKLLGKLDQLISALTDLRAEYLEELDIDETAAVQDLEIGFNTIDHFYDKLKKSVATEIDKKGE